MDHHQHGMWLPVKDLVSMWYMKKEAFCICFSPPVLLFVFGESNRKECIGGIILLQRHLGLIEGTIKNEFFQCDRRVKEMILIFEF